MGLVARADELIGRMANSRHRFIRMQGACGEGLYKMTLRVPLESFRELYERLKGYYGLSDGQSQKRD